MNKAFDSALDDFGISEFKGKLDNPEVIAYFNNIGFDGSWIKDETSWCCAFMNSKLKDAGFEYKETLNARSLLDIGDPVEDGDQVKGDIVIFWRGSHENELIPGSNLKKGHVGFFVNERHGRINVLGGNQSNRVCIISYPKNKLLAYRRPKERV